MAEDAAASPAEKRQKTHWSDDETSVLIRVWEDHLPDLRRAKRNMNVYLAIQECLRAQGIEKSVKEIKSKIENLDNRYRNLTRKTTGQGAITWRFYKDIARFLGSLPINNMSLVEETRCGGDTSVEMIIHTMENGTTEEEDVLLSGATETKSPSAPTQVLQFTCTAVTVTCIPAVTITYMQHRQYMTKRNTQPADRQQKNKRTTQKTLLAQLVSTNQQLCADLKESRRQEMELRRMELEIMPKRSGNASAHAPSAKAVSGLPERGIRSAYEQPKRSARPSDFALLRMAAYGDSTLSASAAASLSPAQRKPRKRFRIDEDLCLLKEVACADPFSNPTAWEDVLRNVMLAVNRELTICSIKERVDLLIGYFRQQDTANLRKSGTEEQYGEREQVLQNITDLIREADYAPRTVPWKVNGMEPPKKKRHGAAIAC
ncbi:hypothetical protein HPB50_008434 [Hyalomma asiaticum]|uniref:Uncharacterized protein n=1 Tax=Hyalomma asiaticum TaxID=266040 RepID=A0ACB7TCL9_HYAAI|nr:hypothetical protein HPB50_008434 [Hyalomma asiaticum]